jgi:Na+/H+ antiporter NhaD/arsenite permease-like protein
MILLLLATFILGYLLITLEHAIHINKAAIVLITAVLCWTIIVMNPAYKSEAIAALGHHLSSVAEIVFFLLGAMTIVELIDAHDGFQNITEKIKTTKKSKFIWTIALLTFFLSAVLDNLTSTIVMLSIINKLVKEKNAKWHLLGLVIIAANAGGAWSPIGDVTTTMLWIGHQMTPLNIIKETFLASLTCMVVPTLIINYRLKGDIQLEDKVPVNQNVISTASDRNIVFIIGILSLIHI